MDKGEVITVEGPIIIIKRGRMICNLRIMKGSKELVNPGKTGVQTDQNRMQIILPEYGNARKITRVTLARDKIIFHAHNRISHSKIHPLRTREFNVGQTRERITKECLTGNQTIEKAIKFSKEILEAVNLKEDKMKGIPMVGPEPRVDLNTKGEDEVNYSINIRL